MADIRMLYLSYQKIEAEVNDPSFSNSNIPSTLVQLKKLLSDAKLIDQRFISLNKNTLYPAELQEKMISVTVRSICSISDWQKKECEEGFC
jgi:hypothetical protein